MKKRIFILVLSFCLFSCQGKDKEVIKTEQVETQEEQKKLHWWELPQYTTKYDIEIIEMRSKENQEKIGKLWDAFIRIENKDRSKIYLRMEDINLTNDLYYQAIKSQGFQFPSEEVFAKRINEIFGVDIYADHSNNSRIVRMGDFLILNTKVYPANYRKKVPTIDFDSEGYIFDMKRRFLTQIKTINGVTMDVTDDYGESYDRYIFRSYELDYNNYIFYNSKVAFVRLNESLVSRFDEDFGYEDFLSEYDYYYEEMHKFKLGYFKSSNEGIFRDYRMYERFLFARDFNGNLKPRIKMLEAMVELAKEDSDYAKIPLDYYSRQLIGVYTEGEYAASLNESIDPYKNPEPYYTKEERAKIWAYLAYYEAQVLEHYIGNNGDLKAWVATTFADTNQQITGYFYQIAKGHDFYGLDFSKVEEFFRDERGEDWEAIITSWEEVEPEKV